MSDLVERLREYAEGVEYSSDERILKEAADRIEQLEDALRPFGHLANIAHTAAIDTLLCAGFFKHLENARAALGEERT